MVNKQAVAIVSCAVFAAQFCLYFAIPAAQAAVPVEESVEETTDEVNPAGDAGRRRSARERLRNLDIPPTIEPVNPSSNTTTNSQRIEPTIERTRLPQAGFGDSTQGEDSVGGSALGRLFNKLQLLQQEVQSLRGQVEEQDYLLKRLQRDQKEQYLDLDQRVVALNQNKPPPGPAVSTPSAPEPVGEGTLTEREAYTSAFDAMRNRQFDASLAGFQSLIENYPNGQYTPNAYYWIGELYLAANADAELARQSFMQVVSLYPDHQKAPDALYKLGVVYQTLGDTEMARKYLTEVQRTHPASSAANLAAKYAAEL